MLFTAFASCLLFDNLNLVGLARDHNIGLRTAPGCYGTITHMAPETIREGLLAAPCDVYAWGVLLWEMITGWAWE